jgi:hypothetical protein
MTNLKWKLLTKVIREQSKEAWMSLDRESNQKRRAIDRSLINREVQLL